MPFTAFSSTPPRRYLQLPSLSSPVSSVPSTAFSSTPPGKCLPLPSLHPSSSLPSTAFTFPASSPECLPLHYLPPPTNPECLPLHLLPPAPAKISFYCILFPLLLPSEPFIALSLLPISSTPCQKVPFIAFSSPTSAQRCHPLPCHTRPSPLPGGAPMRASSGL